MPLTPNRCRFRDWRTFFHQNWEQEPFLRIHRKVSDSDDFRTAKFQNFYWPEMQNVMYSLDRGTKFHLFP